MNRTIKNIFAIAALTLAFAPALRCENVQTTNTSRLQSAIEYLKNIRKPLTPQEKLAQYIAQADIAGFKNAYNSFQKWPADERTATLQALTDTAQEVKQQLQTELNEMGDKVNKTTLAKGVAQTVGGAILFIYHAAFSHCLHKYNTLEADDFVNWADNSLSGKIVFETKPFKYISDAYNNILLKVFGEDDDGDLNASEDTLTEINTAYALAGIVGSACAIKSGLQNCKNGWNHKAYLEQQIANIDKISAFIQAQLK